MHRCETAGILFLLVTTVGLLYVAPASVCASVAPLSQEAEVAWSHAPYEMGECGICHVKDDPAAPGPINGEINELCFGCHVETQEAMDGASVVHAAAADECTSCHNPHNAANGKLLLAEPPELCAECHSEVWDVATKAPVRHDAVHTGAACLSCHNPHASNVEAMLNGLAFDLCVGCHTQRGLTDDTGVELTNFGRLLESNPVAHGPVEARDCSACHHPHGGDKFRMLAENYPAKFYASFDPVNYSLCFSCHNETVVSEEQTTTLTGFRDGSRNLHFVHVNKAERGRTCRACHEVHAAPQDHLIRDGVPYGKSGWVLKINYTKTTNGGSCDKTCHGAKPYDRSAPGQGSAGAAP